MFIFYFFLLYIEESYSFQTKIIATTDYSLYRAYHSLGSLSTKEEDGNQLLEVL